MFLASNVVLLIVNLWLDLVFGLKTIYLFFCQYNLVFLKKSINAFHCKKKIYFGSGRPTYLSVVPVQVGACLNGPKFIYVMNKGDRLVKPVLFIHAFFFSHA